MKAFRATLVAVVLAGAAHGSELAMSAQTAEQKEEDAIEAVIAGESMNGAAEIEKGLSVLFQTRNRNATVRVLTLSIRLLRPDVALAYVTSELSGVVGPGGRHVV